MQFSSATLYGRKERNLIAVTQNKIVILIIHTDRLERAFPGISQLWELLANQIMQLPKRAAGFGFNRSLSATRDIRKVRPKTNIYFHVGL